MIQLEQLTMDLRSLLIRELTVIAEELIRESLGGKLPRRGFSEIDQTITKIVQNFSCNRCGKILDEYNFHHKDGNRSNNHISNCEILCLDCHVKVTRRAKIRRYKVGVGRKVA